MRRVAALLALTAALPAQRGQRTSGPEAGRPLPAIRAYATSGRDAGEEFDVARRVAKSPAALLFIHEISRNTAPVIRGLDQIARDRQLLGLRVVPILLHADRTQAETRLKAINGSLRLANPIVLSLDGVEGPGELALNRRCTLTLILVRDGKVHRSVGFTDVARQDVDVVRKWIGEINGPLPKTPAEWRVRIGDGLPRSIEKLQEKYIAAVLENGRLRYQNRRLQQQNQNLQRRVRQGQTRGRGARRGDAAAAGRNRKATSRPVSSEGSSEGVGAKKRVGKPPSDEVLLGLLRPYINKLSTTEKVDDLYLEITTHAAGKPELGKQVYDMFRLVLSLGYGTDYARKVAERHVREHERKSRK